MPSATCAIRSLFVIWLISWCAYLHSYACVWMYECESEYMNRLALMNALSERRGASTACPPGRVNPMHGDAEEERGGEGGSRRGTMNRLAANFLHLWPRSSMLVGIWEKRYDRMNVADSRFEDEEDRALGKARGKKGEWRDRGSKVYVSYAGRVGLIKAAVPTRHARFRRSGSARFYGIYASSSRTHIFHLCHREYSIQSDTVSSLENAALGDLDHCPDFLKFLPEKQNFISDYFWKKFCIL